ncbi:MAG TPA: type II toxin-antitoxin system death-on-curing family toxin [Tepidisphaeraceae bacterium]|nr:type II toxin-antitoxin system death-on-curing family toxin [Tepidisphaeraceae bacterium]
MSAHIEWLTKEEILAVHEQVLAAHGGTAGVRDPGLLESALGRPQHLAAYGQGDVIDWAAAYAHGIANNHPFLDGNKRTAFVAAALFLECNGFRVIAAEEEVVLMVLGLADKSISQDAFAEWLRQNVEPA